MRMTIDFGIRAPDSLDGVSKGALAGKVPGAWVRRFLRGCAMFVGGGKVQPVCLVACECDYSEEMELEKSS